MLSGSPGGPENLNINLYLSFFGFWTASNPKFTVWGPLGGARKLKFKVLGPPGGPQPSNLRFLAFPGAQKPFIYKFIFMLCWVLEGQKP